MSGVAVSPRKRVPEQIEAEDLQEGTVVLLVKWRGVEEPTWIPQRDATGEEFSDVVAEWESAKASGVAQAQGDSGESADSESDSSDEHGDGPSEMEQLGMEAAVQAAESGAGCAAAAATAAAAVRAGGGSKEEQASAASSAAAFVAVVQGLAPREAAAAAAEAFDAAEGAFDAADDETAAQEGTAAGRSKRSRSDDSEGDACHGETAVVPSAPSATASASTSAKRFAGARGEMSTEEEAAWVRTFEARFRSTLR